MLEVSRLPIMFHPLQSYGISRRAFVFMPVAFGGFVALLRRPERPLPDDAINGDGIEVNLLLFSKEGRREGSVSLRKIRKSDAEWWNQLSAEEFAVTRRGATELAFNGRYWNCGTAGLYRCVCCGTALFKSADKFDSGTGWPSFSAPAAEQNIYTANDESLNLERTEVLCRKCDAHLGHVFADGPAPAGLRYCINSAALRLVAL